jgi:hypothetical protein
MISNIIEITNEKPDKYIDKNINELKSIYQTINNNEYKKDDIEDITYISSKLDKNSNFKRLNCITNFKRFEWLKPLKVKDIWISSPDLDKIKKYVSFVKNKTIETIIINISENDKKIFFKPNIFFYILQCTQNVKKEQNGNKFKIIFEDNQEIIFYIAYQIYPINDIQYDFIKYKDSLIIIQNEDIYSKQHKYLLESKKDIVEKISEINNQTINDTVKTFSVQYLQFHILLLSPNNKI